jgi:predicted Zn-dependent protease
MDWSIKAFGTIAVTCALLAPVPAAASRIVGFWSAAGIAHLSAEQIRLTNRNKEVLATVSRARVIRLIDVLSRVGRSAGVNAELFVVQLEDKQPNAFAAPGKDGRNVVGVTPAMLELLGDDFDAHAAVIGHELAHLVRQHGADRASRQGFLQGLGLIASILIGARTGVDPSGLVNLGATLIDRGFSRDEEREADRLGLEYMASSGFDPQGAIRLHRKMAEAGKAERLAFLSTHPGDEERIASVQGVIASLPPVARASAAPRAADKKDAEALVRRGDWYGLLALCEEQAGHGPPGGFWWYHMGFAHQKLGNHREAVAAYQVVLEHQSDYPNASLQLGYNYLRLEQLDKAAAALEAAVRTEPGHASAWYGLGIVYHRLGQRDKAWDVHQELKRLDPKRAERFAEVASVPPERPQPQLPAAGVAAAPPDSPQVEEQERAPTSQ